jgi:DNA-directed RNA polymerase specialized sigma24 family protein
MKRDDVKRLLVAMLTPDQRRVVVLLYGEDLTEAEAAEAMGLPVGHVRELHAEVRRAAIVLRGLPSDLPAA